MSDRWAKALQKRRMKDRMSKPTEKATEVPKEITIHFIHPQTFERVHKRVLTSDYVPAKIKQLAEFGYPGLTEKNIHEQILALRNGNKFGEGLDAIGMMMKDEVTFE